MSISYQARPWRADTGWAWWLLCQPSPNVSSATHQRLRGVVLRLEAARSPEVRGRVHEPGRVQAVGGAGEYRPQHVRQAAERGEREADDHLRHPVPGGEPHVDGVLGQVGHVPAQHGGVVVHRLAHEDPAHVRPEGALARRVRIAVVVRVLVVDAVRGHPEDRAALERERAADRQEVLDPLVGLVAAVRQQAVVGHADAEAAGDEPHDDRGEDGAEVDVEERGDGADVERRHRGDGDPVVAVTGGSLAAVESSDFDRGTHGVTTMPCRASAHCNSSVSARESCDSRAFLLPLDAAAPPQRRRVARALVPAAHWTPPALLYMARSTTICAGVVPRLSTTVPKRLPTAAGKSRLVGTLVRLLGAQREVPGGLGAVLEGERHPRGAAEGRRVADQDVGLEAARPADLALGQGPLLAHRGRAGGVVAFVPARERPGPPHRALGHHRHVVEHAQRRADRRVGQLGPFEVHPDVEAAVGRDVVGARDHRAVGLEVAGLELRDLRGGVGDQEEQVEERPGRALAEEPLERGRLDAHALVPGPEQLRPHRAVHRPLDDDRHVVGHGDGGRELGLVERRVLGVDPDVEAAARRHGVGLDDGRGRRGQQVPHLDLRGDVARVLDQVEQVEAVDRGALGQEPLRERAPDAGLGVAAVAGRIPRHRAVGDDRLGGRDHGRELRRGQAEERLRVDGHPLQAGEVDDRGHLGLRRGPLERHRRDGGLAGGVEQRDLRVEEVARGAFREVAREGADLRHEELRDFVLREVREGLTRRVEGKGRLARRDRVGAAGQQAREDIPPLEVGRQRGRLRPRQRHRHARHAGVVQVAHLPADREDQPPDEVHVDLVRGDARQRTR